MREVYIVSACRTAIGKFGGALSGVAASELGATVIKGAVERAGISPGNIDEVIMGHVLQAGQGQGPVRQATVKAGIPESVPAMAVNNICGSGLRAITLAASVILAGDADTIVAGGMENMSAAPYVLNQARYGYRMNDGKLIDSMVNDSLTDAFEQYHMGVTAENLARDYSVTREEQDQFAANSQQKAERAMSENRFADEIVPVEIAGRKETVIFDRDEYPRAGVTAESLAKLRPAFLPDGTVTAGNASGINDGAAAVVLMSAEKADELGIKPLCKIVSYASAGVDHKIMGIGPVHSTKKALDRVGLKIEDIELVEANEAFASQSIAVSKELGWDMDRVNVNGGAIALGHPVGASGARILVTLIHEMIKRDVKKGLATLCVGGGMGVTLIVER